MSTLKKNKAPTSDSERLFKKNRYNFFDEILNSYDMKKSNEKVIKLQDVVCLLSE